MSDAVDYRALARSSRRAGLVSLIGLLILLGSVGYSYVHLTTLRRQITAHETRLAELRGDLQKTEEALREKQKALEKITPAALQGLGYKDPYAQVPAQIVEQSAEAKRAAERLADPSERARRRNIAIQYFPKKLDEDVNMKVVLSSLSEAGFTLERREAKFPGTPTNAIWFGDDVRLEDVKLVAYTLIGAGVKVRAVRRFRNPAGRPRLIQIGANAAITEAPPLTAKQVLEARSFDR